MGSNIPLLLGWLLAGVTTNLETLYVARIMWGCATGMQFATVPIYIGEIAEVRQDIDNDQLAGHRPYL